MVGRLTERVAFETRVEVDDGAGNRSGAWGPMAPPLIRAASLAMTSIRAGEEVLAGRLAGVAPWDLMVRHDSGTRLVTTAARVRAIHGGETGRSDATFAIRSIGRCDEAKRPDPRGAFLLMQLQAGGVDD